MIEGFLKYRKIKKNKDTPGPGTYHHDEPKEYLSEEKQMRTTSTFKIGLIDRFGDFTKDKHNARPNLGPG